MDTIFGKDVGAGAALNVAASDATAAANDSFNSDAAFQAFRVPLEFEAFVAQAATLPLPGRGNTIERWRELARLAAEDLNLCKVAESHADALAILTECRARFTPRPRSRWAVWITDMPSAGLRATRLEEHFMVSGRKTWCAGAPWVTDALVSARDSASQPLLLHVHLDQPGVQIESERDVGVGLRDCGIREVTFDNAIAEAIGTPGEYVSRPGYWHASMGIAACWYGATLAIAQLLRERCEKRPDAHARAHLGAVDIAITAAAGMLRGAADVIDAAPKRDLQGLALRVRGIVEYAASTTVEGVGRALGAAPLCLDPEHSGRVADLMVFLRQSHAERDLEQLSAFSIREHASWIL